MAERSTITIHRGPWIEPIDAYGMEVEPCDGGYRLAFEVGRKHAGSVEDLRGRRITFERDGQRHDGELIELEVTPGPPTSVQARMAGKVTSGDDDFERQRISGGGPTYVFHGRAVAEVSSNPRGDKDRWQEIVLWETRGGAWIVELIGRSVREGDQDFRSCHAVEPGNDAMTRALAVMDWLEWSPMSRELGREMGWKFNRWVD